MPASISICDTGFPTDGYIGSPFTSSVDVRTAGYAVPGCWGADGTAGTADLIAVVGVDCGGASILIAFDSTLR